MDIPFYGLGVMLFWLLLGWFIWYHILRFIECKWCEMILKRGVKQHEANLLEAETAAMKHEDDDVVKHVQMGKMTRFLTDRSIGTLCQKYSRTGAHKNVFRKAFSNVFRGTLIGIIGLHLLEIQFGFSPYVNGENNPIARIFTKRKKRRHEFHILHVTMFFVPYLPWIRRSDK